MTGATSSDVRVARLTAPGRGAVAVLRVDASSPSSAVVIDEHFRSRSGIRASSADVGRIVYGDWGPEDVVVVRTGPRQWEVHCHGGEVAVARIRRDLGRPEAAATNETKTTNADTLEQRLESALRDRLLQCRTQRTAKFMLAQQQGILLSFVRDLRASTSYEVSRDAIQEYLNWQTFAFHLTTAWKVAIAGQPNAGKSSLLNSIVGFDRSIVFDQPGTTRDRVETEVIFGGWPFCMIDTAGIRERSDDEIESVGVESARMSLQQSDACVIVVDAARGWSAQDAELVESVPAECACVVAMNKSDLTTDEIDPPVVSHRDVTFIRTSALKGAGIQELLNWLPTKLVPSEPPLNQPLPVVDELTDALRACAKSSSLQPLQVNCH